MRKGQLGNLLGSCALMAAMALLGAGGIVGCAANAGGGNVNDNTPANENDNTPPANENDNTPAGPDGAALYATNCAVCHGADGASGSAPDITNLSAADVTTGLASATHDSIALTAEEVAAIADFLAD